VRPYVGHKTIIEIAAMQAGTDEATLAGIEDQLSAMAEV
jgi:hypothetical protein